MKTIVQMMSSVGKVVSAIIVCGYAINANAAILTSEALTDSSGNATGSVTITDADGNQITSGSDVSGAVTITANGDDFSQWIGTFPSDATINGNQISFTMPETDVRVTPVYNGMWILINDDKLLCDTIDNWELMIDSYDTSKKTFNMGRISPSENSVWKKNLFQKGEGYLDLSTAIVDTNGVQWTVRSINNNAFGVNDDTYGQFTDFIAPETWAFSGQNFNTSKSVLTNVVFNCPMATSLHSSLFINHTRVNRMVLKLPKCTTMHADAICMTAGYMPFDDTNADEWDLSGLQKITSIGQNNAYGFFVGGWGRQEDGTSKWDYYGLKFKGTLRLPVLSNVCSNMLRNTSRLDGAEVGLNGFTVKEVRRLAFGGTCAITNLAIGFAEGSFIEANAISLTNRLEKITFLGARPKIEPADGSMFDFHDRGARTVCFYVPYTDDWKDVFTNSTTRAVDTSDPNYQAFIAGKDSRDYPTHIVSADVFGTANEQFVAMADLMEYGMGTDFSFDVAESKLGDTVISSHAAGEINPGTVITLTANIADHAGTVSWWWEGLPDTLIEGDKNSHTIKFVVDAEPIHVRLYNQEHWVYVKNENVISNSLWKLKVFSGSNNSLVVGTRSQESRNALTDIVSDRLDLSAPVYDTDDEQWYITTIQNNAFSVKETGVTDPALCVPPMKTLIFSKDQTTIGNNIFGGGSTSNGVREVIIDCPKLGKLVGGLFYNKQAGTLTNLLLKIPKATIIENQAVRACSKCESDVSEWDFSSVGSVGLEAFAWSGKLRGVISFPAITNVLKQAFNKMVSIEGFEFGTGLKLNAASVSFGERAVAENSSVKSLVFGPYKSITCSTDSFSATWQSLKTITFMGYAPKTDDERIMLDRILANMPALTSDSSKNPIIRGSRRLGWEELVSSDEIAPAELAKEPTVENGMLNEGETVMGIYETLNGARKAWLVDYRSEHEPKGTILIIR